MVSPLLSRRWWLLIFIALKQHESKTAATQNKYKQNNVHKTDTNKKNDFHRTGTNKVK